MIITPQSSSDNNIYTIKLKIKKTSKSRTDLIGDVEPQTEKKKEKNNIKTGNQTRTHKETTNNAEYAKKNETITENRQRQYNRRTYYVSE